MALHKRRVFKVRKGYWNPKASASSFLLAEVLIEPFLIMFSGSFLPHIVLLFFAGAFLVEAVPDLSLYEHTNFYGASRTIRDKIENLKYLNFDNTVTSMKIKEFPWLLYEGAYFRGKYHILHPGNYARANETGLPNDSLSSCRRIPKYGGPLILLFKETSFHDQMKEIRGSIPDLGSIVFDDETSSILVIQGTWTAFSKPNYQGKAFQLPPGRYANPTSMTFDDNSISSLKLV